MQTAGNNATEFSWLFIGHTCVWFNAFRLTSHCESKPPTINQNLCSISTCSKALQMINSFCLEMHGLISGVMIAGILAHSNSGHRGWVLEVKIEVWQKLVLQPIKIGFLPIKWKTLLITANLVTWLVTSSAEAHSASSLHPTHNERATVTCTCWSVVRRGATPHVFSCV